jgi:flagellar hook-length control protein FliK
MIPLVNSTPASESGARTSKKAGQEAGTGFEGLLGANGAPEEDQETLTAGLMDEASAEMEAGLLPEELALFDELELETRLGEAAASELEEEFVVVPGVVSAQPGLNPLLGEEFSMEEANLLRQDILRNATPLEATQVVLEGAEPRVDPQSSPDRAAPGIVEQLFAQAEDTATEAESQPDVSAVIRQMVMKQPGKNSEESPLENLHEFRTQNQRIQELISDRTSTKFQATDPTEQFAPEAGFKTTSTVAMATQDALNGTSVSQQIGTISTPAEALDDLASRETEIRSQNAQQAQAFGTALTEARGESITSAQAPSRPQVLDLPFDFNQVMTRVRNMRDGDVQEMTVQLEPEHLGKMVMKVRQQGGELILDLQVDNPAAKQIVESGFDLLRNRVTQQDLNYRDLSMNVNVGQEQSGTFEQQQARQEQLEQMTAARRASADTSSVNSAAPATRVRSGGDSGLNLYI